MRTVRSRRDQAFSVLTGLVCTYTFEGAGGDSTRLRVAVRASGEIAEGWADAVDRTWRHFIFDRFFPHVASGAHLGK
ncbi:MAG: hypothetical protein ABIK65_12885 [Candidatus Eisenbacteria bacterium]